MNSFPSGVYLFLAVPCPNLSPNSDFCGINGICTHLVYYDFEAEEMALHIGGDLIHSMSLDVS
jgi:hypothetical protein